MNRVGDEIDDKARAEKIVAQLKSLKASFHWGHYKIHPWIHEVDRDLIIRTLEERYGASQQSTVSE